ncbi:MAG TPA: hypothetical protein VNJ07_08115 [Chitinophagales bacterium]|nr:hypothetical protein [Chitinophagales bacterium]
MKSILPNPDPLSFLAGTLHYFQRGCFLKSVFSSGTGNRLFPPVTANNLEKIFAHNSLSVFFIRDGFNCLWR